MVQTQQFTLKTLQLVILGIAIDFRQKWAKKPDSNEKN